MVTVAIYFNVCEESLTATTTTSHLRVDTEVDGGLDSVMVQFRRVTDIRLAISVVVAVLEDGFL